MRPTHCYCTTLLHQFSMQCWSSSTQYICETLKSLQNGKYLLFDEFRTGKRTVNEKRCNFVDIYQSWLVSDNLELSRDLYLNKRPACIGVPSIHDTAWRLLHWSEGIVRSSDSVNCSLSSESWSSPSTKQDRAQLSPIALFASANGIRHFVEWFSYTCKLNLRCGIYSS